jgi:hypothetical protein
MKLRWRVKEAFMPVAIIGASLPTGSIVITNTNLQPGLRCQGMFQLTGIGSNTAVDQRFPRLFCVICKAKHFKVKWADHAVISK